MSMKKEYAIKIHGRDLVWEMVVEATCETVDDWIYDGLDVEELINEVPDWIARIGLTKLYFWLQNAGIIRLNA